MYTGTTANTSVPQKSGSFKGDRMAKLIVDTGPMFGGKSLQLINRIQIAEFQEQGVVAVRPATDRHPEPFIVARRVIKGVAQNATQYPARIIQSRREFRETWSDPAVTFLAIDEGQFFPSWIVPELAAALDRRRREYFTIAVAGLNLDYARRPFGQMPKIMALALEIRVWPGVCMKCKGKEGEGFYTQRTRGGTNQVQPGDVGDYEVRCGVCHYIFKE